MVGVENLCIEHKKLMFLLRLVVKAYNQPMSITLLLAREGLNDEEDKFVKSGGSDLKFTKLALGAFS